MTPVDPRKSPPPPHRVGRSIALWLAADLVVFAALVAVGAAHVKSFMDDFAFLKFAADWEEQTARLSESLTCLTAVCLDVQAGMPRDSVAAVVTARGCPSDVLREGGLLLDGALVFIFADDRLARVGQRLPSAVESHQVPEAGSPLSIPTPDQVAEPPRPAGSR